jgi:DMSO reductase anchor subunit
MHPASSVILFTTTAGAGYGLLFLLGIAVPAGFIPAERWLGLVAMTLALGAISLGLLASTFHLGHPERAWRALSQWRSSWLSREGVVAAITYVPAGIFAVGWVVFETAGDAWALAGLLAALGALLTVVCTAMIYASLETIRQWHNRWVVPVYLGFALMTGALWLNVVLHLFGPGALWSDLLASASVLLAWGLKLVYWRAVDGDTGPSTPESATGLSAFGTVRLLDPPHSHDNYLLREMGFRIARKHAGKLRRIALVVGFGATLVCSALAVLVSGWPAALAAVLAALSGSLGTALERWLFFAEARHSVTLYYGARAA